MLQVAHGWVVTPIWDAWAPRPGEPQGWVVEAEGATAQALVWGDDIVVAGLEGHSTGIVVERRAVGGELRWHQELLLDGPGARGIDDPAFQGRTGHGPRAFRLVRCAEELVVVASMKSGVRAWRLDPANGGPGEPALLGCVLHATAKDPLPCVTFAPDDARLVVAEQGVDGQVTSLKVFDSRLETTTIQVPAAPARPVGIAVGDDGAVALAFKEGPGIVARVYHDGSAAEAAFAASPSGAVRVLPISDGRVAVAWETSGRDSGFGVAIADPTGRTALVTQDLSGEAVALNPRIKPELVLLDAMPNGGLLVGLQASGFDALSAVNLIQQKGGPGLLYRSGPIRLTALDAQGRVAWRTAVAAEQAAGIACDLGFERRWSATGVTFVFRGGADDLDIPIGTADTGRRAAAAWADASPIAYTVGLDGEGSGGGLARGRMTWPERCLQLDMVARVEPDGWLVAGIGPLGGQLHAERVQQPSPGPVPNAEPDPAVAPRSEFEFEEEDDLEIAPESH